MRILFVTPSFPYPPRRGYSLIAYHQIKYLARRHSIDLISFTDTDEKMADVGGLSQWCKSIRKINLPAWQSYVNIVLDLFTVKPFQVSYYRSAKMTRLVDEILRNNAYDAIIFQLTRMAQYNPGWYRGATILNMVDPFVLSYQRSLPWRPWYLRLGLLFEINRLRKYEREYAPRFARSLLLSENDAKDYGEILDGAKIDWVPYGVDTNYFATSSAISRQPGMIVMSGSMFYAPNVDAVDYFCRSIFPLVHKQVPNAKLFLVGARPAATVRKWGDSKDICVTGSVPDIRPYLSQAMVSICPVRLDVGTQTKVLEALAMETPVVTTSAGNCGIEAISGQHLYVADAPEEFAERVGALLKGENWKTLSQNGRHFVTENFIWEKSVAKLEKILGEISANNHFGVMQG